MCDLDLTRTYMNADVELSVRLAGGSFLASSGVPNIRNYSI